MAHEIFDYDYITTGIAANGTVRAFAAQTTNVVNNALKCHSTSPTATAALGRLLTAGVLMSSQLKNDSDLLTIQFNGKGPLGRMIVVSDAHANVRGFVRNPHADLPLRADGKLDVGGLVGKGFLVVTKDLGLKEPYVGTIPLVSGEIAEDIAQYFMTSEQVPSVVSLGVLVAPSPRSKLGYKVHRAGGFMIQLMPGASEDLIADLENRVAMYPPVTTLLAAGATPSDILQDFLGSYDLKVMDTHPCKFSCSCSRSRMKNALKMLDRKEIDEMLEQDGQIEICCHFCNKKYIFTEL